MVKVKIKGITKIKGSFQFNSRDIVFPKDKMSLTFYLQCENCPS